MIALLLLACSSPPPPPEPPAEAPAPAEAAPVAEPAPVPAAEPEPERITDEECLARGGRIVTEETYAHLDRRRRPDEERAPFRICRIPSPKNGQPCSGDADCDGGRCFCTGELGRPDPQNDPALEALDGTEAHGVCSDEPVMSGSWFCLVRDGRVNLHGIIVD